MRYLSVCSGIEAATVAWDPLGWEPVAFSEIEDFPRAVLERRHDAVDARETGAAERGVPLWGDFTTIRPSHFRRLGIETDIDLLVGGTPCQSFSIAGLRKGMADARGSLALHFLVLARRFKPRWILWENVPGVLSADGGRAFGSFLGGLEELGYGWAYRVLDAQYVRVESYPRAVPQRRRRVFVVGRLGDWRPAAAVLFEPNCVQGNPPPRRAKREEVSPASAESAGDPGGGKLSGVLNDQGPKFQMQEQTTGHSPTIRTSGPHAVAKAEVSPTIIAGCDGATGTTQDQVTLSTMAAADPRPSRSEPKGLMVYATLGSTPTHGSADEKRMVLHPEKADGVDWQQDGHLSKGTSPTLSTTRVPAVIRREGPEHVAEVSSALHMMIGGGGFGDGNVERLVVEGEGSAMGFGSGFGGNAQEGAARTLNATEGYQAALPRAGAPRRLTPRECERLQGFPDDFTLIPWEGGGAAPEDDWVEYVRRTHPDLTNEEAQALAPDSRRFRALGNSMAVNVMRWIGERLDAVQRFLDEGGAEGPGKAGGLLDMIDHDEGS